MTAATAVQATRKVRPSWPWLLTFAAFPPVGYVAHAVAGPVDAPTAAVIGGAVTGVGLGLAQWAALRHRGVGRRWVVATAAALAAGIAAGAAAVSYRTDRPSLAVMGAVSGLAVGLAQGAVTVDARRTVGWAAVTAVLWAIGWTVSATIGVDVESQYVVFGASGALAATFAQSLLVDTFITRTNTAVR